MDESMVAFDGFLAALDELVIVAKTRHAEARMDLDRLYEWREWFGFRPGWPARRAARLGKKAG